MKWQRQELVGRRAELDALRRHSQEPALLVVRGPAGSGKSAVLRRLRAELDGVVFDLGRGPAWDEFRAGALLAEVRANFEALAPDPRVAESIEAVRRLCVPESYHAAGSRHRLLGAISVLMTRVRARVVIMVDDADQLPAPAIAPLRRAGHTVVVSCGDRSSRGLVSVADVVVDLPPLTEEEIGRLLWQVSAAPVDEAVTRALRENLGPQYGNAGTLVSTVESLWDEGRLAKVHGVLALRSPRTPIALAAGHHLLAGFDEHAETVVRLAKSAAGLRLDHLPELAETTGRSAHDYGRAVDRLVDAGVLADEGGRLRCRVPAVATDEPRPAQRGAVGQFIAAADYDGLAAYVETVPDGDPAELAAAAALAAIHTGRRVSAAVRSAVAPGPLALADRWSTGARVRVADLAQCLHPLHGKGYLRSDDADVDDLVPVLKSVLGPRYRVPADGPVAVYHRVCRGYAEGDWTDAVSAARELELMSGVDTPVRDAARLRAAEICGWRGEDRQAASWFAAVGEDTRYPGLRGWVATGLLGEDAYAHGWAWYTTHDLEEPGAARLLVRLATIATEAGDRYGARAVLRAVRARYEPRSVPALLVRGLVESDVSALLAAEEEIRERGTRFDLALVCRGLARLSGDARPWLDEAYELARSLGAARLVSATKQAMADHGVVVRVRRARPAEVSDVERRIVELIRLGKTNREIALVLRVSAKTVEKHLTRLFAKAGCRTRHGLATSDLGVRAELVGA